MVLTPEQAEERKNYLNASEIAALFGLHPWITQGQMWAEKLFDMIPQFEEGYMGAGNKLEPSIMAELSRRTGLEFEVDPDNLRHNLDGTIFACTYDGLHEESYTCGEAKFWTGWLRSDDPKAHLKKWGEEGTDEVPQYIILQGQHQMMVKGLEFCEVCCFVGARGEFRHYTVHRSEPLIESIIDVGNEWWTRHIVNQEQPSDEPLGWDVVKRIRPKKRKAVELAYEIVQRWREAHEANKLTESDLKSAKSAVSDAMLDAEWGLVPDGEPGKIVKFSTIHRKDGGEYRKLGYVNTPKEMEEHDECTSADGESS